MLFQVALVFRRKVKGIGRLGEVSGESLWLELTGRTSLRQTRDYSIEQKSSKTQGEMQHKNHGAELCLPERSPDCLKLRN